ncbi:MAG: calcium/sodium antiporter [Candidatus Thermoplasmatota archaeon]|nr:calcium/sodium antiporter [Candidatus Thermoplasmatota archaeon]
MIDIALAIPVFIVGIILLWKGSDILVEGTSKTAAKLGISSLIISLIIVAFGTSAPEFAISVGAAFQSRAGISLGNIIGSCVANILLVLGLSAIIRPINIKKSIMGREMPILVGATIVLFFFSFFGLLDAPYHIASGVIFLILFATFVVYFLHCAKKERSNSKEYKKGTTQKNILFIILGIVGVVVGAWLLIESAVTIADFFNIPPFVIAVSMIAIGTSLPELVVSVTAAHKGESDIAVGNVLGSNVFNIFLILGACALFIPLNATGSFYHLLFLMMATLILFPVVHTGHVISRKEGVFFLALYSFFIWYIFFGYTLFI